MTERPGPPLGRDISVDPDSCHPRAGAQEAGSGAESGGSASGWEWRLPSEPGEPRPLGVPRARSQWRRPCRRLAAVVVVPLRPCRLGGPWRRCLLAAWCALAAVVVPLPPWFLPLQPLALLGLAPGLVGADVGTLLAVAVAVDADPGAEQVGLIGAGRPVSTSGLCAVGTRRGRVNFGSA